MRRRRGIAAAASALVVAILAVHNVPDAITEEDIVFGDRILAAAGYEGPKRGFGDLALFENQIRAIAAVQVAVISMAKLDEEIPFGTTREPRDIFEQKKGLCYDRARAIEKILSIIKFKTRHVSVYATDKRNAAMALLTPGNNSHALTEVKTARGWMVVDPNARWMALTPEGQPLDATALRNLDVRNARWAGTSDAKPHPIFSKPYVVVRGLYSRHGRFYPPYWPIPDVNWRQLLDNFGD